MDCTEFNLSVLENVTNFVSRPENFDNQVSILSLIKEEIDIKTEDERESQKGEKTPLRQMDENSSRELEFCDGSKNLFKSPRANYSIKVKSPTSLFNKREARKWRNNHSRMINELNRRRARSLGYVKPGRSFGGHRNYRFSVSQCSDTSAPSESGDSGLLEKQKTIGICDNSTETESEAEVILGIEGPIRMDIVDKNMTSRGENESVDRKNDEAPIEKIPDDDYVESSQSTVSLDLREKLDSYRKKRRSIANDIAKIPEIGNTESEEDLRNFSLKLSPASRSSSADKVGCGVMSMAKKRKATVDRPLMVSTPKQKKLKSIEQLNDKSPMSPIVENGEIGIASAFNCLSQDSQACLVNSDYERMTAWIDTDLLDRTSFTFETIELLNEYESANQSSNNNLLSKILSSPTIQKRDESRTSPKTPATTIQPTEDPLFIEENKKITTRRMKKNTNISEKAKKSTSSGKKKSLKLVKRSISSSEMKNCDEPSKKINSSTSERKNNFSATNVAATMKSNGEKKSKILTPRSSHLFEIENDIESVDSKKLAKENSREDIKEENTTDTDESEVDGQRRRSARLKIKKPMNVTSDFEDDHELIEKAKILQKKIAKKRLVFSDEILTRINDLVVRLRHEVLPQHKIECHGRLTRLEYDQQKEFVKFAPLKKSYYNKEEDATIRKNWQDFCEDHNWDPKDYQPFLHLKVKNKLLMSSSEEIRKFLQYLANGLPNRPLNSVYKRFRILYGNQNPKTRYTEEDDKKIWAYMLHVSVKNPQMKYTDLARVLKRTYTSIANRRKILSSKCSRIKNKRVSTKVDWDLSLAEEFVRTLADVTLSDELIELKDAFIPKVVWLKMEEKMDIDYRVMKRFWDYQLHLQLFSPKPIYLNKIKILLIKLMHRSNISCHSDINWSDVVKYFDGATIPFLRRIFNHMVWGISPKIIPTRTLEECLEWLYTVKMEQLKSEQKDKILPRIMYEERRVAILPEDLEIMRLNCNDLESE